MGFLLSREREGFSTLVLGIRGIHVSAPTQSLVLVAGKSEISLALIITSKNMVGGRRDSIHRLRDPICWRREGTEQDLNLLTLTEYGNRPKSLSISPRLPSPCL